jgi:hypothetical protein
LGKKIYQTGYTMKNIKVSVIIPSINPTKWYDLYNQMLLSSKNNNFELIFVGPYLANNIGNIDNIKYIMDYGSPSRCFQMGSLIAEGEYIAWGSDDYMIEEDAFDKTFDYISDMNIQDDGVNLLYSEGPNFTGNQHVDKMYWYARTHADLREPGVKDTWWILGAFMYRLETWYKYGGLDCGFEHVNMNTHDFGFAIQANGGRLINSPCRVYKADWSPWNDSNPMKHAWEQNDKPRFQKLYADENYAFNRKIDINNWKEYPSRWKRRFK